VAVVAARAASPNLPAPVRATVPATPPQPAPEAGRDERRDDRAAAPPALLALADAAERAGFRLVERFASTCGGNGERLWVLLHEDAGALLTALADAAGVLDASLHYNVRDASQEALAAAFDEHKDESSRTLYVRQACADDFTTAFRVLRQAGTLEREWKVSPALHLLTPEEWRVYSYEAADRDVGARAIAALSRERLAALPASVRQQIGVDRAS
jgi:hypothetical protein